MANPLAAAAAAAGGSWVVDVESARSNPDASAVAAAAERRRKSSIYMVPAMTRDRHSLHYTPQLVSFGPFHHGGHWLAPMEQHKHAAFFHFLHMANTSVEVLKAAVEEVAEELMDSYEGLNQRWRGDREAFLQLMIMDGCFMLEILLFAGKPAPAGTGAGRPSLGANVEEDHPVFGFKGRAYVMPWIVRDMLLVENQLPLRLLQQLARIAFADSKYDIQELVVGFFTDGRTVLRYSEHAAPDYRLFHKIRDFLLGCFDTYGGSEKLYNFHDRPKGCLSGNPSAGAHVLDVYRSSMILQGSWFGGSVPNPAGALEVSGLKYRFVTSGSFKDISFDAREGCLHLPIVHVGTFSVSHFLNLLAFERLHPGAGNEVNNYLVLMGCLIHVVHDVIVLLVRGIITCSAGMSPESIFEVFKVVSNEATLVMAGGEDPHIMESNVGAYYKRPVGQLKSVLSVIRPTPLVTMLLALPAFCISIYAAFIHK